MTYRGFKIHDEYDRDSDMKKMFVLGGHFLKSSVIYWELENSTNYGIEHAKAAIDRFLDVDTPKGFRFRDTEYQIKTYLNEGNIYVMAFCDGQTIKTKRYEAASVEDAYWSVIKEIMRECQ